MAELHRNPQSIVCVGRFADTELVNGRPPVAPSIHFHDLDRQWRARGRWKIPHPSGIPTPEGRDPLWRAEAPTHQDGPLWVVGDWVYLRFYDPVRDEPDNTENPGECQGCGWGTDKLTRYGQSDRSTFGPWAWFCEPCSHSTSSEHSDMGCMHTNRMTNLILERIDKG